MFILKIIIIFYCVLVFDVDLFYSVKDDQELRSWKKYYIGRIIIHALLALYVVILLIYHWGG